MQDTFLSLVLRAEEFYPSNHPPHAPISQISLPIVPASRLSHAQVSTYTKSPLSIFLIHRFFFPPILFPLGNF